MNAGELPMIAFTVLAQMSVGAFVVLGIVNVVGRLRGYSTAVLDELSDPAAYAIGGTLVLGLIASMFHIHDVFNVMNVLRHVDSSWLSREIVAGMAFAAAGFVYAACQLRSWGSPGFRQAVALVAAVLGVVLVWCMSMVYYSLTTVPAWNTWLGAFAIGAAFMTTIMLRRHGGAVGEKLGPAQASPADGELILSALRWIAVAGVVLLGAQFVMQPMHLTNLMNAGQVGIESAHAFSGGLNVVRIILLVLGAGVVSLFLFRLASKPEATERPVAALVTVAFVCVLAAEFLGRAQFYEQMIRIGM